MWDPLRSVWTDGLRRSDPPSGTTGVSLPTHGRGTGVGDLRKTHGRSAGVGDLRKVYSGPCSTSSVGCNGTGHRTGSFNTVHFSYLRTKFGHSNDHVTM